VGDHGCEYMTGGKVVILGKTGSNFAAGMSGGIAYVLDFNEAHCNKAMVLLEKLASPEEIDEVKVMIRNHVDYTGSPLGQKVLEDWENYLPRFTKVIPTVYKNILQEMAQNLAKPKRKATGRSAAGWQADKQKRN
ncbi:MAG TPA: hypothetical protein PKW50_07325, partial [Syntrophomonas sp.]|nr:hypothetical protein [Syntrophomonas sp.]